MKSSFFPIFMSKKAEIDCFNNLKHKFSKYNGFLKPYVECINGNSIEVFFGVQNVIPIIENRKSDSQSVSQSFEYFEGLNKSLERFIPSFKVLESITQDETKALEGLIDKRHELGMGTSIRIMNGQESFFDTILFSMLDDRDYLFVDLNESNYNSARFFLDDLKNKNKSVKVIVISSERRNKKANKNYCSFGKEPDVNTSILESLLNNTFYEHGFSTYCGYRSNINDGFAKKTYGLILFMNFCDSSFFSIKSPVYASIGTSYSALKPLIKEKLDTILNLLNDNSASKKLLLVFLEGDKKGNSTFYLELSMTHYIEELLYKYYRIAE